MWDQFLQPESHGHEAPIQNISSPCCLPSHPHFSTRFSVSLPIVPQYLQQAGLSPGFLPVCIQMVLYCFLPLLDFRKGLQHQINISQDCSLKLFLFLSRSLDDVQNKRFLQDKFSVSFQNKVSLEKSNKFKEITNHGLFQKTLYSEVHP